VRVLAVSDIHFDPFHDRSLLPELVAAPATAWRGVFERAGHPEVGSFIRETNVALLESALGAMQVAAPDAAALIITGDFVAHGFVEHFHELTQGMPGADLPAFFDKTVAFVAGEIRRAFPAAQILPAIGNNDAPCGNYMSEPRGAFLGGFAKAFGDAIAPQPGGEAPFMADLAAGGYYAVPLRFAPRGRAIVLNTSYWSVGYKNRCGTTGDEAPGVEEMAWLATQFDGAEARGERVLLVGHIPPGLDLFSTVQANREPCGGKYVSMYRQGANQDLLGLVDRHRTGIALGLVGHTHMHELHVMSAEHDHPVANVTIPAVSTIYKNHPAFVVLTVDATTMVVQDLALHTLPYPKDGGPAPPTAWRKMYDFGETFGQREVTGASVLRVAQALNDDPGLRQRYIHHFTAGSDVPNVVFRDWDVYRCSITGLDPASFERCHCRR
jgi:sphingomyelin phosphodiesterase acid-like 3